jgi:hypothetical protein
MTEVKRHIIDLCRSENHRLLGSVRQAEFTENVRVLPRQICQQQLRFLDLLPNLFYHAAGGK